MNGTKPDPVQSESSRVLFNLLTKVPAKWRLEAITEAMAIIECRLGDSNHLFKSLQTMQVVCLVHARVAELIADRRAEEEDPPSEGE